MNSIVQWLEDHMLTCFYKKYLGMDCPGCGMQRAFIELLKGNFTESLKTHPALLPLLLTVVITILHLVFKYRKGAQIIQWSFIFSVIILVGNFIIKQI